MRFSRRCLPVVLLGALVLGACGQQGAEPSGTTREPSSAAAASAASTSSSEAPSPSSTAPPPAESEPYAATLVPVQETRGSTTIDVQLPQVTGGAADVRDRFNSGMRSALDDVVGPDSDVTVQDGALVDEDGSRVTTITDHVIAGVAIFNWNTVGAAHPNNSVATITVSVDTAQPILLSDVFADQQAAADRLSTIVPQLDGRVEILPPTSIDAFLNWVPTEQGFRTYVSVIHAMGDYLPVTVPWDQISDLMTPGMQAALIPS